MKVPVVSSDPRVLLEALVAEVQAIDGLEALAGAEQMIFDRLMGLGSVLMSHAIERAESGAAFSPSAGAAVPGAASAPGADVVRPG